MGFGFCSAVNAEILSDGNKSDRVLHANAPRRQNHNLIRRHRQGPNRNGSSKIYRCGRCVEANNQNDNLIAPDEFRGAQHRIYHLLIYVQHFLRLAIQSIENMIDFVLVFGRMLSFHSIWFRICERLLHGLQLMCSIKMQITIDWSASISPDDGSGDSPYRCDRWPNPLICNVHLFWFQVSSGHWPMRRR